MDLLSLLDGLVDCVVNVGFTTYDEQLNMPFVFAFDCLAGMIWLLNF
jgi:hypothetical protein